MKKALFIILFPLFSFSQEINIELNQDWEFSEDNKIKWRNAEVPGTIHTDLLKHGLIEDPFYRDNEKNVQWVETKTWIYKNVFKVAQEVLEKKNILLAFEGLDTYAEVYLNDQKILAADNMFRKWEVDIKPIIKKGKNELVVKFLPTAIIAKEIKKATAIAYPDNERAFVRKAQYQFGWDWGPRLVTCGIWKNVWLKAFDAFKEKETIPAVTEVELVREKDKWGESFYFKSFGKPIFIKGANWIPVDNFLPRAKKRELYEKLLYSAKIANINMLRVWGGGIYEDDIFYELCDKYGIMVWQDFMFAGALYPATDSFLKNVEEEIRYQVKRLRHHPSIVLWCGNNEIEEAWFNWGWQKQFNYSSSDSSRLWNDYQKIFHQLIPGILKELDPGRPYWPSSPSLGWGRDSAYQKGDVHYWGVWWGKEPVEKYKTKVGRFNSEYGMQAMPHIKTILSFAKYTELDTSLSVMRSHQKHPFGYENLKLYIDRKFKNPKDFSNLVYVSQLMQADAIKTAIEAHRSNMPYTMGTMFWQWNDCWPGVSWSALDYYVRPKAMYYQVKRSYANNNVFITQQEQNLVLTAVSELNELDGIYTITGLTFDGESEIIADGIPVSKKVKVDLGDFYLSGAKNKKLVLVQIRDKVDGRLLCSAVHLFADPKDLMLEKPDIRAGFGLHEITITSDVFAYGVYIDVPDGVVLDDNYFNLLPGEKRKIKYISNFKPEDIILKTRITSLFDSY